MKKSITLLAVLFLTVMACFGQVLPSAPKPQPATPQKPTPKPATSKATQTIKFFSNTEADLYIDGVKKGRLKPEIAFRVALAKGEYMLKIVSVENSADAINELYEIVETGGETIYRLDLLDVINQRIAAENAARQQQLQQQEALRQEVIRQVEAQKQAQLLEQERQRIKQQVFSQIEANMVLVEGGTFNMGSKKGNDYERPIHQVTVSSFYIGKYEVTFAEYDVFCESTGRAKDDDGGLGRGNRPVIWVTWENALAYCQWLSRTTGKDYRLPTEAEWEYAARGGNKSNGYTYSGSNNINAVAWYNSNSGSNTHQVGQKRSNELGLYDMSGNVWEWCSDWYGDYSGNSQTNPQGPTSGPYRVLRGGGLGADQQRCRVAYRDDDAPNYRYYSVGFRVVRVP